GRDGWTNGVPNVTPATRADEGWFDHVQEEIARVIELSGGTLDDMNMEQLAGIVTDKVSLTATEDISGAKTFTNPGTNFTAPVQLNQGLRCIVLPSRSITSTGWYELGGGVSGSVSLEVGGTVVVSQWLQLPESVGADMGHLIE